MIFSGDDVNEQWVKRLRYDVIRVGVGGNEAVAARRCELNYIVDGAGQW